MKISRRSLILLLALSLVPAPVLRAEEKKASTEKKAGDDKKAEEEKEKKDPYVKLLEGGTETVRGFITMHRKDGKVYMEIPDSLLGRELVFGSTVKSISDNGAALVGSKRDLLLFSFARDGKKVQVRERNVEYVTEGSGLSRSTEGAVIKSLKVVASAPDSSAVVDATDFFLGDDERLSPFVGYSTFDRYKIDKKYKKDYSYVTAVKAFEDNVSVEVSRTYTFTATDASGRKVFEDEPLTAVMTCSILLLPSGPYHPRVADPRIGYFFTERKTMASVGTSSREIWLVNRWRIEPSDPAAWQRGELVPPVKPVVFYIDPCFPEWWKPHIRNAVNSWSKPFERIGFKDAVVARDFPSPEEDPEFDPDNIKYSCIRYEPVNIQNAMGPSWVDPRTGEILNASVYVYHDVIRLVSQWMLVQTAQADESVRSMDIPRDKLGDALEYVIRHEVGHCLGLMHNMGASSSIPVDCLRDPKFTAENGTTYSIMDYARFNYIAQPGDKVKLTPPEFGKYDYWAIRWGYEPIYGLSFEEEAARTRNSITDSLKLAPWYRYGKQQMYFQYFDPRNQNEDLGDDVVTASRYGVENLKLVAGGFMDWLSEGDDDYEYRTEIYQAILNQYLRYANHLLRNVGGLYRNEVVAGDGEKRFENVPAARQKACLQEVMEMLEDMDWLEAPGTLDRLPVLGSPVYSLRKSIFSGLINATFSCAYSDGIDTEELGFAECMDIVYDFVWKPTMRRKALTPEQRMYQKDFVVSLMNSGNLQLPKGVTALSDDGPDGFEPALGSDELRGYDVLPCFGGMPGDTAFGAGEVSGFEWLPRSIYNRGNITQGDIWAVLYRVRDLLKSRERSANATDKTHYQLLLYYIDYGTTLK